MSDIKKITPFKQVPFCEQNAKLEITPEEFQILQNVLEQYRTPLSVLDEIYNKNIDLGNIQIKYVQSDGTEITQKQAEEFFQQASEIIKQKENPTE